MYEEMNKVAGWFMVSIGMTVLWYTGGLAIAAGGAFVLAGYNLIDDEEDPFDD